MSQDLMTTLLAQNSPAYLLRNDIIERDIDPSAWAELEDSAYVRAMTRSDWFQSTGLNIPEDATESDIMIAMKASRTLHQSDAWVRGDLIEWMRQHKYNGGDIPREELTKFAHELGVASVKRLLNNATTSRAWPLEYRHPAHELSYSHHEALNAMPLADKQAWAERAITENLSVNALRMLIDEDAVSITQDGEPAEKEVSFASEKLDKGKVLRIIAMKVSVETARLSGGGSMTLADVRAATRQVLKEYEKVGLIRLPAKAWHETLDYMASAPSPENGTEDE